jgi:hypothetical protein
MVHAEVSEERKRLRGALLAYCERDTLAMGRLLEVLYEHTLERSGRTVSSESILPSVTGSTYWIRRHLDPGVHGPASMIFQDLPKNASSLP